MIKGELYLGLGADIWSSGVILFAMMCGYLPFDDKNTQKIYKKILNSEFEMPDFLSAHSKDLISRVLNPDPC